MHCLVREKNFYQRFFSLLIVIALQSLASFTVNLVDNLMLGAYSEASLSGATLVNQIQFMVLEIASGIGTGIVVLCSQYWGKGEIQPIRRIISLGMKVGLLVGIVFFAVTKLWPYQVLCIFSDDEAIISEGVTYLRIMCWTYIIYMVSNSLMFSLRAVETAFIGTIMSCTTILINCCLNYCLIYGNFGFPELGIYGAAIATLVSRCAELVIILGYILFIDKKLRMTVRDLLRIDLTYLPDYIRVAAPVMASGALWGVGQAAQTAILGHMSSTAVAANSIASVIFQVFGVFGMCAGNAASVIIGRTIGEKQFDKIKPYTVTLQIIFIGLGLISCILVLTSRFWLLNFYAVSESTRVLASKFILILGITGACSCYEFPVAGGIVAGGGDTKYLAIVDNVFIWLIVLPSAYISAYVLHLSPVITFCCLKCDQILKCIPNAIKCNRYRWVKVLTRETLPED